MNTEKLLADFTENGFEQMNNLLTDIGDMPRGFLRLRSLQMFHEALFHFIEVEKSQMIIEGAHEPQ